MHKFRIFILLPLFILVSSCGTHETVKKGAFFHWFEYRGTDKFYDENQLGEMEYFNPVLSGFYPDPSVCKKGEDYYLVNSTFSFFPGVPVFHSTDLVNWKQIGHVLDRSSQLNITNQEISEGIFAPAISYNPHNDTFYMVTTFVGGKGNFLVKAKDPAGSWSDPVFISEVPGIDPSLFFDDDGRAWIVNNGDPEGDPVYPGHKAIWIQEYDLEKDEMTGPRKMIVDGGHDISKKPIWIEGPHIYKVNGYYYLMAAEGGTAENHSEVIFRSRNVTGPYEAFVNNPILTQRNLPNERENPVTSTGHADLIKYVDGSWWAVFLGCRPYLENHYNTGRETFLLPVKWQDGWPVILEPGKEVPLKGESGHQLNGKQERDFFPSGNFTVRDDFDTDSLEFYWNFIRTPKKKWYELDNGSLRLDFRAVTMREKKNPSFIGRRQQHKNFSVTTEVKVVSQNVGDRAGLACFRTEANNYFLGVGIEHGELVAFVEKTTVRQGTPEKKRLAMKKTGLGAHNSVFLRVEGEGEFLNFSISEDKQNWDVLAEGQDATYLSTANAGGFVGTYIGMYSEGNE
ncbi:glycoside hydrolase family 43 protein [Marinilabilia salmonicolor]|uniref:glycoside hydrolase family 43 protein n=1 Tax=Marinilabilia salmonicolor TaxID=989 RepID=UPI00029B21E1|nr:glycoside hydrolase family 43 protein [Marinilabilia salmonicolor]